MSPLPTDPETLLAHGAWVRALARRLVRDSAEADDVVQEAWLAALRRPPREGASVRAWLARVVRNAALQKARSEGGRAARERRTAREEALPSPDELLERVELQRLVVDEVVRLDEPYRSAVLLRYFEGLDAAEIARREGVPAATVRSRVKRGLDALRERLDARYGGERRAWALALAPLALPPRGAALTSTSTTLVTGASIMSIATKIALAAGAIALATAAVVMSTRSDVPGHDPGTLAATSVPEPAGEQPSATPDANLAERAPERVAERAVVPASGASASAAPAPAPAAGGAGDALLEARIVDERGVGVPGARLAILGGPATNADASGAVFLRVPLDVERDFRPLVYGAAGYASELVEATLVAGETTRLGDLAVELGATIGGTVLDELGAPVVDAHVWADDGEPGDETPDELRRRGRRDGGAAEALAAFTDESGRFELEGVPLGPLRAWTTAPGRVYAWSEPLVLEPGERRLGLELRLPRLAPEDTIEGVVVDPAGEPVANAPIDFRFESPGFGMAGAVFADERGRFELLLWRDTEHDLTARDPDGRHGPAVATGLVGGMRDVELRLTELRELELLVHDAEERPVERYGYAVEVLRDGSSPPLEEAVEERPGGVVRIAAPEATFEIEVRAPGFATRRLGPFDPENLPERVACELDEAGGVRGRVIAAGEPVAGARVELWALVDPAIEMDCDGFASAVTCTPSGFATTVADGSFTFAVPSDGTYRVRAEKKGWAPAESVDLVVAGRGAVDGVELRLDRGGTLVVRARHADGTAGIGVVVGVARGDANPLIGRTDESGRIVFERVVPGRWNVKRLASEPSPTTSTATATGREPGVEPPPLPWVIVVPAGGTATYDLDVGER